MWGLWKKSPEVQTVLKSSKRAYCSLPKKRTSESGLRKKVSRRSKSSRKGKGEGPAEGQAKKFAQGSDVRKK